MLVAIPSPKPSLIPSANGPQNDRWSPRTQPPREYWVGGQSLARRRKKLASSIVVLGWTILRAHQAGLDGSESPEYYLVRKDWIASDRLVRRLTFRGLRVTTAPCTVDGSTPHRLSTANRQKRH